MKIVAFAASNSFTSINKQLVQHTISLIEKRTDEVEVEVLDLNDFEMPIYRPDREEQSGIPKEARAFYKKIGEADALLISFAEHNGNYTSAYKNLFDWTSRISMSVYQDKPTLLLATSPGKGGAANVLRTAVESAKYFGMDVRANVSVPAFYDHFNAEQGTITDVEINSQIENALTTIL